MARKTSVQGAKELDRLFDRLEKAPRRIAYKAARKGAVIPLRAAKRNAPVDTGNLKRGIVMKRERARNDAKAVYQITIDPKMNDVFVKMSTNSKDSKGQAKRSYYPASQEYGYMTKNGRYIPGYRYMRRAADDSKSAVEKEIMGETMKLIDKELRQR
jgi:hypothetical protein